MSCKFCEALETWKYCNKTFNKTRPKEERLKEEYTVALVSHTWSASKGKRNASRTVDYRNKGLGYKLNYCPECGKELR